MGVPAFFRWLTRKYPSVVVECVEQKPVNVDGVQIPVDSSELNPNGVEFDNLYLDMNGIIHPCTHPEDKPAPKNEDEMMIAIFECIDRLFRIVRPRKLLYMAIDGVAPRAKMNQQRSRRFRSSKEITEKVLELSRIKEEMLQKGYNLPPEKEKGEHFDSNCITPGTPFMDRLSRCLHYYIHERLQSDPGWSNITVILSDANVPGEGEHKIMDFIRKQRGQPNHDPNTRHVLCGADADLIMLGLATHEPNFTIIREEFKPNKPRPCEICAQIGHEANECVGIGAVEAGQPDKAFSEEVQFVFVRLNILREYLERELLMPNLPFKYDFERAVDDWVFMCFFVGNDFLPHLPSLEIREGAIDRLVNLYKKCVYKTGGYITNAGDVDLSRVQMIMTELGEAEDEIFKKRQKDDIRYKMRTKRFQFNQHRPNNMMGFVQNTQFAPTPLGRGQGPSAISNPRQEAYNMRVAGMHSNSNAINQNERMLKASNPREGLEAMIQPENSNDQRGVKRKSDHLNEEEDDQAHDEVRLWEDGFKDRYYESKFDVAPDNLEFRYKVALQYVRGLCWVLRYYYQGCASWKWYFPYHYAPFASDFVNIEGLSTEFEVDTKPFRPLEQLMGVFPAASSSHVPQPWAKLMSDPDSPIIDFYPEDFKIDLNGKKFPWQGVALLPFVDETRLFKALEPYYEHLTQAEIRRNIRGDNKLYVNIRSPGYNDVKAIYDNDLDSNMLVPITIQGMSGTMLVDENCICEGGNLNSPVAGLKVIFDNTVYCARFQDPTYTVDHKFPAITLKGAILPPKILKPKDFNERQPWRPQIGMAPARNTAYLGQAGHRMVNHYSNKSENQGERQSYAAIPPPQNSYNNNRDYQRGGRGGYQSRGRGGFHDRGRGGFNNRGGGDRGYQGNGGQQRQQSNNYSTSTWRGGGGGGGGDNSSNFRGGRGNYGNHNEGHVNKYSTSSRGNRNPSHKFFDDDNTSGGHSGGGGGGGGGGAGAGGWKRHH